MIPTPTTKQVCTASKANGTPCKAFAVHDSLYCHMHAPERANSAAEARSAGGKNRATPAPAVPCDLSTPEAQIKELQNTVDRVRRGDEPVNVARLVIYAIQVARPAYEMERVTNELNALRAILEARKDK